MEAFGQWKKKRTDPIGSGGNGLVYLVVHSDGREGALKIPKGKISDKAYLRFRQEVTAYKRCLDIPSVLPLLDSFLPEDPRREKPWLVLKLATKLEDVIDNSWSLRAVVEVCRDIAITLHAMHKLGISHRDIKPSNLFFSDGLWSVGDLGLVQLPDAPGITEKGDKVGPLWYIAPEMIFRSESADGRLADVYSLAKVLWVLGSGQRYPLQGRLRQTIESFRLSKYSTAPQAALLEPVLDRCTDDDPDGRLSMEEFVGELNDWLAPISTALAAPLDLSAFSNSVRTLNQDTYVKLERERENDEYRRPYIQELEISAIDSLREMQSALNEVGFLPSTNNPLGGEPLAISVFIQLQDKIQATLSIHADIKFDELGKVVAKCQYMLSTYLTGSSTPRLNYVLFDSQRSFVAGTANGENEFQSWLQAMRNELPHAVRDVVDYLRFYDDELKWHPPQIVWQRNSNNRVSHGQDMSLPQHKYKKQSVIIFLESLSRAYPDVEMKLEAQDDLWHLRTRAPADFLFGFEELVNEFKEQHRNTQGSTLPFRSEA